MVNSIQILLILHALIALLIFFYTAPKQIKHTFMFFLFRDQLTIQITKVGTILSILYAILKTYITLTNNKNMDNSSHATLLLLAAAVFEPLLSSIFASILFYNIFSGLQDRHQFKNDFAQLFSEYNEMKSEIMRIMI